ncbi:hypothetical protein EDC94DRAFT_671237 [Helicostylum pulchrum]|nr:hypothetical protein EDC94DRAFT_671237 [Helicostylum pulchrum]
MNNLSSEVHKETFLHLTKKGLQAYRFVCKSLHSIVIPFIWKEVKIQDDNISLVKSYLNEFNHGRYFKHGHLIKKLTIEDVNLRFRTILFDEGAREDYEKRYKFSKLELLKLLNQLPNLKEIDLSDTSYFVEYLEFLLDANLKHVNKIDARYFDYRYCQETYNCNSQQTNAINSLTQFKELTALDFRNKYDTYLTPFRVQDQCPKLKNLIASDYPISESVMLSLLDKSSKINLNSISSLRNLVSKLPSLSNIYTRYLVDYIPNQLTDLSIEISRQSLFNWFDIVEIELALGLMEKISIIA